MTIRFHVIGNVAVLSLPAEIEGSKKEIAEALILKNKSIRTVLNKNLKAGGREKGGET